MNIAEGSGRHTRADYARFIDIAAASKNELEYQLILGWDLGYLDGETAGALRDETREVQSMLTVLAARIAPNRA